MPSRSPQLSLTTGDARRAAELVALLALALLGPRRGRHVAGVALTLWLVRRQGQVLEAVNADALAAGERGYRRWEHLTDQVLRLGRALEVTDQELLGRLEYLEASNRVNVKHINHVARILEARLGTRAPAGAPSRAPRL